MGRTVDQRLSGLRIEPCLPARSVAGPRRGELMALRPRGHRHRLSSYPPELGYARGLHRHEVDRRAIAQSQWRGCSSTSSSTIADARGPLASSGGAQRDRSSRSVPARADAAWAEHGLERRTLHIARHAYSSSLADAGVPKDLRVRCRGHADPTMDGRYAREVPGNSRPADAELLDPPAPLRKRLRARRRDLVVRLDEVVGVVLRLDHAEAVVDVVGEHPARLPRLLGEVEESTGVPRCKSYL
jgi:hypothetical protein